MKGMVLLLSLLLTSIHATAALETIEVSQLEVRDGISYDMLSNEPFTGRVIGRFYNGEIRSEVFYRNGLKDGPETTWYQNGGLRKESNYKEGLRHGEWTSWDRNQRVLFHRIYNEGERVQQF